MALPSGADIPLILSRIRPAANWGWRGGATNDSANLNWRDRIQTEPTQSELEAEWNVIEAEQSAGRTVKQTLKATVDAVAGSPVSSLSNQQLVGLVEVLIAIFGGIDFATRNIKPAAKWSIARELLDI